MYSQSKNLINKKVGIMGGTFDPIHVGHLILAEHAYEKFNLDKVCMMPAKTPPHKPKQVCANIKNRVRMAELAIENNKHFEILLTEVARNDPSYTFQSLESLKSENPDTIYYFILGGDSLFAIEHWKYPDRIFKNCRILVGTRYNVTSEEIDRQISYLQDKYQSEIFQLNTPNIDISSTMIRTRIHEEKTIKYFVPQDVEHYIYKNELYKQR